MQQQPFQSLILVLTRAHVRIDSRRRVSALRDRRNANKRAAVAINERRARACSPPRSIKTAGARLNRKHRGLHRAPLFARPRFACVRASQSEAQSIMKRYLLISNISSLPNLDCNLSCELELDVHHQCRSRRFCTCVMHRVC